MNRNNIKELIALAIVALLLVSAVSGCITFPNTSTQELTKVKLTGYRGGTIVAQYVALDKGYFEDDGLDVEIVYFDSPAGGIPAVIAGDVDFGIASNSGILAAIESGVPIKAIGVVAYNSAEEGHVGCAYVTLNESGIKNVGDVKGKRIAIPYVGGDHHIWLVALLEKYGIGLDEVTSVVVPYPLSIDALARGNVDVACMFSTHLAKMDMEGLNYTIVATSSDLLPRIDAVMIYSSTDYIENHPDVVRRFLRAFYRGQTYLETHPAAYRECLANYTGFQPQVLEKLDVMKISGLPHGGRFNETFWRDFVQIMVDTGFLKGDIPINRIYTEEYLPKLEELSEEYL